MSIIADSTLMGRTMIESAPGIRDGRRRLVAALAGMAETDRLPRWPLRLDDTDDERVIARLCHEFGFDEDAFRQACSATRRLRETDEYKDLQRSFTNNLLAREHVDEERLNDVANAVLFGVVDREDEIGDGPDVSLAADVAAEWERIAIPQEVALLAEHARGLARSKAIARLHPERVGHVTGRVVAWS